MRAEQVDRALSQKFFAEGERLVFWHDPNSEFVDYVAAGLVGDLAEVQVLEVAKVGGLAVKLRLEQEDHNGQYLVYSQGEPPAADKDWLLDIRLYSAQFHADVASLWLQELGLTQLALRNHFKARAVFLRSQERRRKLGRLISVNDDEATLDLKMLAVLVGSEVASPFDVLRALCHGHVQNNAFDLNEPLQAMVSIEKMGLMESFWVAMQAEFAYTVEAPSVSGLLRRLFVSELFEQTDGVTMNSIAQHRLPAEGRRNAVVFLTQWRDSSSKASSYDRVAESVAKEQKIGDILAALELDCIKDVYTFWEAERRVVSSLKEQLLAETPVMDVELISALASTRKAGHWLCGAGRDQPVRLAVSRAYDAIVAAAELFALHRSHRHDLQFATPADLLDAYQHELYRFDRLYRQFCIQAKPALGQGWDLLKTLAEKVERVYDQGFVQPLGIEWSRLLDAGFLQQWSLQNWPAQQDFYNRTIRPHLASGARNRAIVIISDAFRYEAASELTESLNRRYRMRARLSAMLGVLPSYTALGMASLLPHKTLSYSDKGEVWVDGNPAAGTAGRNKQLATVQGMACQARDLLAMKRDEAREFIKDQRVVYIYHNVIDARGDSASTEGETFDAVTECIAELVELVKFCVNKLNAGKVWITADHGFLYQQEAPGEVDKSRLDYKPEGALRVKKRYVIGRQLGVEPDAHNGNIDITAGADGGMEFWLPRVANRFHFTGGARFIHGGAMPQEMVVPVVVVSELSGKQKLRSRSEKVTVRVLGSHHKITTPVHRFEFIQTEAVGERKLPITLRCAIFCGEQVVTSIETVTFDSTSDRYEERKKTIRIKLGSGTYDKATPYRLVLRDAQNDTEVQAVPVVIDRSFESDF